MTFKSTRSKPALKKYVLVSALAFTVVAIALCVDAYRKESAPLKIVATRAPSQPVPKVHRDALVKKPELVAAALPSVRSTGSSSSDFTLKSPTNKPDQVIAESAVAAAAGDPAAMRYTAEALHACAYADMRDDTSLRNKAIADANAIEHSLAAAGMAFAPGSAPSVHVDPAIADKMSVRDSCSKVSTGDAKSWLTKLDAAAAAGDATAKLEYAKLALGDLSVNDKREEPAEYQSRREQAFDYLTDLVADGDCSWSVLEQLEVASPNATIKYIYGSMRLQQMLKMVSANTEMSPARVATANSYLQRQRTGLSALVPEDQLNAADSAATYIDQNICSG